MSTASAGQWVKFFNAAGIPSPAAATYAHIFVENRIQTDMLMDLNKEYLREMGVSLMGDIIAILRHAKQVSDQTARDKVLSSEIKVPVAAVPANPASRSSSKISLKLNQVASTSSLENSIYPLDAPKPARRVLPEHEGKYKIKLPSGSTARSKEILAKKAMLYADKEALKPGVFERLSLQESEPTEQLIRIIGLDKTAVNSSIFSRLGGKDDDLHKVAGILKTSPNKKVVGVSKKIMKTQQKVMLIKKIPAKAATMIADEFVRPEKMETGEKTVSFSSEDEVFEIAPRRVVVKPRVQINVGVKSRLGSNGPKHSESIHKTKKIVKLKPANAKKSSPLKTPATALRMRSDELLRKQSTPVHSRLDLTGKKRSVSDTKLTKLTNRIGRVSLSSVKKYPDRQTGSVFDRLGYSYK